MEVSEEENLVILDEWSKAIRENEYKVKNKFAKNNSNN